MTITGYTIAVCTTAFNEEENLPYLLQLFSKLQNSFGSQISFMVVDNGSSDSTATILETWDTTLINFSIETVFPNLGYGGGMIHAVARANAEIVCLIPSDNQYSFDDIRKCLEIYLSSSADLHTPTVVVGERISRSDPFSVRLLSRCYSRIVRRMLGLPKMDINGLPKVFPKSLIDRYLGRCPTNAVFDAALLYFLKSAGVQFWNTPVHFAKRVSGANSWSGRQVRVSIAMLWTLIRFRLRGFSR